MIYQEFLPAKPLRSYIRHYVNICKSQPSNVISEYFFPPTLYKGLVFHYFEGMDLWIDNETYSGHISLGYMYLNGTKKIFMQHQQPMALIAVIFQPGQFRHFFPFPALDYLNDYLPFEEYTDRQLLNVLEQVVEYKTIQQRLQIIELYLLQKLKSLSARQSYTDVLLQDMFMQPNWKLKESVNHLKLSERHVRRLFSREMGISPKQFHKLLRFTSALSTMQELEFGTLSQLAYSTGYADPNHFIEHFKEFTGSTPSTYLKKIIPHKLSFDTEEESYLYNFSHAPKGVEANHNPFKYVAGQQRIT